MPIESSSYERPLTELLNPRVTPELGFQSYLLFDGDSQYREKQKRDTISGEIVNPELDYPDLENAQLMGNIDILDTLLARSAQLPNKEVRSAVWDSISYRMAEMYWVHALKRFHGSYKNYNDAELDSAARSVQELNEQLYGRPEAAITEAILSEIWTQVDSKKQVGKGEIIRRELAEGATLTLDTGSIELPAVPHTESEPLPEVPEELLHELKDKLLKDNTDIIELVFNYWDNVIKNRPSKEYFKPTDMYNLFLEVHAMRDPDNSSGVDVIYDIFRDNLSWDTSQMAVIVGGRRNKINDPMMMVGKIIHEYGVHAGRAIQGSKSKLPVLGTGLFTEADEGETSDYLTFEEGLATMCERTITDASEEWQPLDIEKYLAISLAYEGRDFRQIYETLWRVRVLMKTDDGLAPTEKAIGVAKRNAYGSTLRVFRGTPTTMARQNEAGKARPLTYNKDLSYLKGKLQVIDYWKQFGNDPAMLDLLFKAKFDPLNKRQLAIVKDIFTPST